MSVAPNAGVVALDNFKSPTSGEDGIQGQVPKPLAGQTNYVLTGNGWSALSALGVITYQGTWDASANTPTLTSSVGTQGYYYVVSVAGSTNLNGITSWSVGDWAIFNGSVWEKINSGATLGTMAFQNANSVAITGGTESGVTHSGDTIGTYLDHTAISAPSYVEGRTWYDSAAHALSYYNDSSTATVHIGQDLQFKVINNTGSSIANGAPVYITSTSSGQTYPNIALAKADVAGTSNVAGLTNGSIANGAIGYVTAQGVIDGVNTGSFTVGQVLYLSPYSAGQLMNTVPPTGTVVQVGIVSYVNSSAGKIYVKQTTPLTVSASTITGQVAVANGGTGASTASGARTNLGLGTIATQDANNVAITGGAIDGTTVGATTASTGAFTTLSASSTVSGTGFSTYLASPPAIGGTAAAAGTFTTLIGGADVANYGQLTGGATTKAVEFKSLGSDTNVAYAIRSKGTGAIDLAAGSSGVNISNGGTVTAITRTVNGSAYTSPPTVAISAPTTAGGVQATATSALAVNVGTPVITSGGTGYTVGDTLTFVGGTNTQVVQLTVSTVSSGVITGVSVSPNGIYTVLPSNPISVTGGTGTGATFTATTQWGLSGIFTITAAGSGYVEQPTVTFSGGGGSGAAAYATVGSGTKVQTLGSTLDFYTPNQQIAFRVQDNSGTSATGYWTAIGGSTSPILRAIGIGAGRFDTASAVPFSFLTNQASSSAEQFRIAHTASAVNYVQVTGSATGGTPTISAQGSDANPNVAIFPKGLGIVLMNQQTPTAVTATGTLTIANLLTQIITSTSATAVSLTLPTGTLSDAGVSGGTSAVNTSFDWSIINTGSASGDVTLVAGTAHTIVGSATVTVGTSGKFRSRKTATNTFVSYRV